MKLKVSFLIKFIDVWKNINVHKLSDRKLRDSQHTVVEFPNEPGLPFLKSQSQMILLMITLIYTSYYLLLNIFIRIIFLCKIFVCIVL